MNRNRFDEITGRLSRFSAAVLLLAALAAHSAAQTSTDPDSPTPMTSNVVTGKSNGKARTHYYSFNATGADPGEVKVKVTASTDERSTNLRVNFLDEDGRAVMGELYVIPNRDPATKVGKHTFAERQKVVVRVTLPEDPQVKLLNYRIEVTGAVEFEQPGATAEPAAPPTESDAPPASDQSVQASDVTQVAADPSGQQKQAGGVASEGRPRKNVRQKVKEGAEKAGKSALKDLLKDNLF
ncbi:MAG TPA: hypothetical protein VF611_04280 [Pyrinomonadaceae bacterium]|jgi:hypothetical protein